MSSIIPRYGLAPPSEDDALLMLARALGVDRAAKAWLRARRAAGLQAHGKLTPEELLRAADALTQGDGCEPAIGTSLAVRVRSWILLNRQRQGAA
ncbi:MAG TPA: hypothetical protein VFJ16_21255 [Longimicrobium sp.]|nr:hypothetical protein [Longimicrobium sp.]